MRRRFSVALVAAGFLITAAGCGGGASNGHSTNSGLSTTYVNAPKRIFTIPSSAMEPTLHCAKPAQGCRGTTDDRVVVQPGKRLKRLDIVVFTTPPAAATSCGEGGVFVKRLIGLPGEAVRQDDHGFIWIREPGATKWVKLNEPYVSKSARLFDTEHFGQSWHVPQGHYFMVGDNRSESCDSRVWGSVPANNVIGPVVKIIRTR
jgi:signal peptidase I